MPESIHPDLTTVEKVSADSFEGEHGEVLSTYLKEAREFLLFYNWCDSIAEEYVGILIDGIVGLFLFRIVPNRKDVDEWIWIVVGDLPPTYLTCETCPDPGAALDGYIGAMQEWVDAATNGKSVANVIPVNVPASKENAERLRKRLEFLDRRVLAEYRKERSATRRP
jgi:hypothetical protein